MGVEDTASMCHGRGAASLDTAATTTPCLVWLDTTTLTASTAAAMLLHVTYIRVTRYRHDRM